MPRPAPTPTVTTANPATPRSATPSPSAPTPRSTTPRQPDSSPGTPSRICSAEPRGRRHTRARGARARHAQAAHSPRIARPHARPALPLASAHREKPGKRTARRPAATADVRPALTTSDSLQALTPGWTSDARGLSRRLIEIGRALQYIARAAACPSSLQSSMRPSTTVTQEGALGRLRPPALHPTVPCCGARVRLPAVYK